MNACKLCPGAKRGIADALGDKSRSAPERGCAEPECSKNNQHQNTFKGRESDIGAAASEGSAGSGGKHGGESKAIRDKGGVSSIKQQATTKRAAEQFL